MTVGNCLMCGDKLKYYDSVRRIVRTKSRKSRWIIVPRYQCVGCRCIRRYLPDYIYPYKQYESEIIDGVIEGLITCDTVGFEDYPCELTMIRWKTQNIQLPLWNEYIFYGGAVWVVKNKDWRVKFFISRTWCSDVKDMNTRKLKLSEKKYLTCVFNYRELDLRIWERVANSGSFFLRSFHWGCFYYCLFLT